MFHKMYPNITIPEPEAFFFYRWSSDPLYRGSYSNWPASFFQEHHDNLRATVDGRLWFSGEHCSQKYYVSRLFDRALRTFNNTTHLPHRASYMAPILRVVMQEKNSPGV